MHVLPGAFAPSYGHWRLPAKHSPCHLVTLRVRLLLRNAVPTPIGCHVSGVALVHARCT